jgi:exopolyphosphatase/guanosine-5'-triphosphate,3'-diphosphate pyrophosphatase
VLAHRRRFDADKLALLRQVDADRAIRVAALLRIAVRLNRGREGAPRPEVHVIGERVELVFPAGFLDAHPMTRGDMEEEQTLLREAGIELSFR